MTGYTDVPFNTYNLSMLNEPPRMNPVVKDAWLGELRSGEREQTVGQLCRVSDEYRAFCCLGVLCELAVEAGLIEYDDALNAYVHVQPGGFRQAYTSVLPEVVARWAGLTLENPRVPLSTHDDEPHALSVLNDGLRFDFFQIANVIESEL